MNKATKLSVNSFSSSVASDEDPRVHYNGSIVDLSFRPTHDRSAPEINKDLSVYDILIRGPKALVGRNEQQVRWIHLPANNMAWVEELFKRLHQDQEEDNEKNPGSPKLTGFDRVLPDEKWRNVFHGRKSSDIHARFITPHATRYSSMDIEDSDSEESEPRWQDANITSLYLPYLHWENYNTWKYRQQHIAYMKKLVSSSNTISDCGCSTISDDEEMRYEQRRESLLLHNSLFHDSPLHDRRTLDQSYFYNLRNVAKQDKDQVIGQSTWDPTDDHMKDRKMMMVDQLWLWIVDGKTIVTAFPNGGKNWKKKADILSLVLDNLRDAMRQGTVRSLFSFTAFLVDHCTGVFHRSDIHPDLAFFEFMADAIGRVKNELEQKYETFHNLSKTIETFWTKEGTTVEQMSAMLDVLFSIKHEIQLISDVEKVISDLDKIDFLCSQQEETIRNLIKCSKQSRSLNDLSVTLKSRREAWAGMSLLAKGARESLHGLLDLKQRQATVGEARSVRYQIELSAKQGRSIMLLTVFTVFFMPISVMATIFGMNARELNNGNIAFSTISAITFPTTITLVLAALGFAFSEDSRAFAVQLWTKLTRGMKRKNQEMDPQRFVTKV